MYGTYVSDSRRTAERQANPDGPGRIPGTFELLRKESPEPKRQYAPEPRSTTRTVRTRMTMSSQTDQLRT